MSQFNDPTFGNPPPAKKSSTMMWIIILLVVLLGLPLLCCGGCMALGMWGINMGSAQIASELQGTAPVQEHLGDNLTMKMNFTKTMEEQQKAGGNDDIVAFDATGSKGSGTVIVTTSKGGADTFESATLRLPDGREFPLN
jgi:hypothetical protein